MKIIEQNDYEQLSQTAAEIVIKQIEHLNSCLIGLATGHSPKLCYSLLAKQFNSHPNLISKIKGFQIDEWYGLSKDDPSSCSYYIYKNVILAWQLDAKQCFLIDGKAGEIEVPKMQAFLQSSPIDICILGIGQNGHLALNEPGSLISDSCRLVGLEASSQQHNMLSNTNLEVKQGITIGLKEILESKFVLLLITGKTKKEAFHKLITKPAVESFPASVLYQHQNCICLLDNSSVN